MRTTWARARRIIALVVVMALVAGVVWVVPWSTRSPWAWTLRILSFLVLVVIVVFAPWCCWHLYRGRHEASTDRRQQQETLDQQLQILQIWARDQTDR